MHKKWPNYVLAVGAICLLLLTPPVILNKLARNEANWTDVVDLLLLVPASLLLVGAISAIRSAGISREHDPGYGQRGELTRSLKKHPVVFGLLALFAMSLPALILAVTGGLTANRSGLLKFMIGEAVMVVVIVLAWPMANRKLGELLRRRDE